MNSSCELEEDDLGKGNELLQSTKIQNFVGLGEWQESM